MIVKKKEVENELYQGILIMQYPQNFDNAFLALNRWCYHTSLGKQKWR